ncbi:hypothetical protein [Kineosporia sp. NBRC 101731]|uniref:hypothetical protein n=1 Tax=Kineosporia sp. NBRC 101731 TaxID=3032199 RepID=UPI0024A42D62|nr:hypothetical protein [Kineosporia sp. NBRC 101731]GLY33432.1 hypothetical protein Kisp02_67970 [Kineosporia sp. NBRC 101731]
MSPKKRPRKKPADSRSGSARTARVHAARSRIGAGGPFDPDYMPFYEESPLLNWLGDCPGPQIPIYAVVGIWHQLASRAPLGTCVIVAHQLCGALRHLGIDAQPVAATASVYELVPGTSGRAWQVTDTGTGQTPPTVSDPGMTDGHMVLLVPVPGLVIDASIVQNLTILRRAYRDTLYSVPAVAAVPPGAIPSADVEFAYDESLRVTWQLHPQWTHILDQVLAYDDLRFITEHGALVFAHHAMTLIAALMEDDPSLDFSRTHPRVDALARGTVLLPPID